MEDWRRGEGLCWLSLPHPIPEIQFPQKATTSQASSGKPKGVQAEVSGPDSLEAVATTLSESETRVTSRRTCPFQ